MMLLTLTAQAKEPKFYKGQKVKYNVGFFLHKVCSGNGIISDVGSDGHNNYTYDIATPQEEQQCPIRVEKEESEIQSAE